MELLVLMFEHFVAHSHQSDWHLDPPGIGSWAPLWEKRDTSPISAISCGQSVVPTPAVSSTIGYSGGLAAVWFIRRRSDSTFFEAIFSWSTAWWIKSFVTLSFGSSAVFSCGYQPVEIFCEKIKIQHFKCDMPDFYLCFLIKILK